MSGEDLERLYDESSHDDAVNEVRYSAVAAPGIPSWCHDSWERNYDVDVKAFILPDGRALAFCEMSGGEERVIKTYKFEDMPEASEVTP
ncbi:hypothetical protein [Pseudomonas koreensis]|uniref:hypothetical protein n=1 Tax=Pseudomonas koreensis TaxID=198620 RepID=UPI001AA11244|nr:hypothetical protein [Pseudomonas koreensis]